MTDHNDTSDGNDPIDTALGDAGKRLRRQAPDATASRQALARMPEQADAPMPGRRSWWPALIGAGLAAAAVVGVIAIRPDDNEAPTLAPVTEPTSTSTPPPATSDEPGTTPSPSTADPGPTGVSLLIDGGCITVTMAAGSAIGCPQDDPDLDHLEQRTFVADIDGPVLVTSSSADPLFILTATVDTGEFESRCRSDDLAPRVPDGGLVEVVVCNNTGMLGATTGRDSEQDWAISYFTVPTPHLPDGADLGPGSPIEGLPRALAFTAPVQDIVACSILLLPDRSGWRETCDEVHGLGGETGLIQLDSSEPTLYETTTDDSGLITSARALDAMAPSSGCSIGSANDLVQAVPVSSIVIGIGRIDDKAGLTSGSVLTQDGPPDGSIWTALRADDVWAITDSGTGIETTLSFPIVPFAIWSTWPESTVPGFRSYWWEPIVAIPTQPTVDTVAQELLATLGRLGTDPEFPLNERLVEVQPGGLTLIVAQVDIGGDDSVAGAVIYAWLDQEFDDTGPIGWRAGEDLAGEVCARGGTGEDLCVRASTRSDTRTSAKRSAASGGSPRCSSRSISSSSVTWSDPSTDLRPTPAHAGTHSWRQAPPQVVREIAIPDGALTVRPSTAKVFEPMRDDGRVQNGDAALARSSTNS